MKKVQQLILFSTLFLLLFSCKKNDPPETSNEPVLPPMTHEGLNTFGCYIDGELFVANDGPSVVSIPRLSGSFGGEDNILKLQGTRYENGEYLADISFKVKHITEEGEYSMFSFGTELKGYITSGFENCDYYHNPDNYGFVRITYLDNEKNIIAGIFEMKLINPDCVDTLKEITDGRFDFRY